MESDEIKSCLKAGKIASDCLEYGKNLIIKGNTLLDACDKTEERIFSMGAKPAFPVQISMDNIAAHFCPDDEDKVVFGSQVCCLDVGVHVDGFIGDNACTVDLSGSNAELVKASKQALEDAIKVIRVGCTLGEIGGVIQNTIGSYGFSPVRNLSGHGLAKYVQHTKPSIPNFDTGDKTRLHESMLFAIEPFASTGSGVVQDSGTGAVYSLVAKKPVRSQITRDVLEMIDAYDGLPFAKRWLTRKFGLKANLGLRELLQSGIIREYRPLADSGRGLVSQAEHTILIGNDGNVTVTTMHE